MKLLQVRTYTILLTFDCLTEALIFGSLWTCMVSKVSKADRAHRPVDDHNRLHTNTPAYHVYLALCTYNYRAATIRYFGHVPQPIIPKNIMSYFRCAQQLKGRLSVKVISFGRFKQKLNVSSHSTTALPYPSSHSSLLLLKIPPQLPHTTVLPKT